MEWHLNCVEIAQVMKELHLCMQVTMVKYWWERNMKIVGLFLVCYHGKLHVKCLYRDV